MLVQELLEQDTKEEDMAILDSFKSTAGKIKSTWDSVNTSVEAAKDAATYTVMDAIISDSTWKAAYEAVMLSTSAAQVVRNQSLQQRQSPKGLVPLGMELVSSLSGIIGLLDVSLITEAATAYALSKTSAFLQDIWEKTLMLPNIEGIPISSSTINTSREIDVGDQPMIVQSTSQKQYWTDNAVPKLKEWTIDGYITPSLSLDNLYLVKPSLKMQMNFLDMCAASRRPVLFKDNRGEFTFVNIMNLQTTEEASYNNAIKVTISLKEYKPFTVKNVVAQIQEAVTNPISLIS